MRLFIAVDLPEEAKDELRNAQQHLPDSKLSKAKDFHITLKFLGEVQPHNAEEVNQQLQKVDFKAFNTSVDQLGVFPNEKYIRVVWAGIRPEEEMLMLQKKIDEIIGKEFPDDYKFSAHITLARVKYVENKTSFIEMLKKIKIKNISFTVDSFKLKKSTLSPKGPVYEDLESFPANEP